MKREIKAVMIGAVVLGCTSALFAADRLVPGQYLTIQAAIDAAGPGDRVIISQDTYTGAGNKNLDFGGKAITVQSANPDDWAVIAGTVIDCENAGRGFHFHSGEGSNSIVRGLTVTRGKIRTCGDNAHGGGIYCSGSSPTVEKCFVTYNRAWAWYCGNWWAGRAYGGGICCEVGSHPTIVRCRISNNLALGSDGPAAPGGNAYGGGIYCSSDSSVTVKNCVVSDNECRGGDSWEVSLGSGCEGGSAYGGGIYCSSTGIIGNCTITGNIARGGYGDSGSPNRSAEGGWIIGQVGTVITNCIVWANIGSEVYGTPIISYSNVQGGYIGEGNINADPCFSDGYHLRSG